MDAIVTKDGVGIFYKDWGPRDAQPIVFDHGWPLSAARHTSLFLDTPNHFFASNPVLGHMTASQGVLGPVILSEIEAWHW